MNRRNPANKRAGVNVAAALMAHFSAAKMAIAKAIIENTPKPESEDTYHLGNGKHKDFFTRYANRYSHVLTEHVTDQNLAAKKNGKSGFQGFRKVRKTMPNGMSRWVGVIR